MNTSLTFDFANGHCHALTAALARLAPAGECLTLRSDGAVLHSIFRVPHTQIYLDAYGAEEGEVGRQAKAARYSRLGDDSSWEPVADVTPMVPGNRRRVLRAADKVARALLRDALVLELRAVRPS